MREKSDALRALLTELDSVVIAFSGGVDSACLAVVAAGVLGDRTLAVTANSPSYPAHHRAAAERVAARFGFRHEFIVTNELERPEYRANPANRCYYCKHELYTSLTALAGARGFAAVCDGSNADDRGDYRPGRAAAREFGVRSPLDEVNLTKDEIRALARDLDVPVWDAPAEACLSSRIPYHSEVTPEKLRTIEQAEAELRSMGFRVCRVRHHDTVARLELGRDEMARALEPDINDCIVRELKRLGFKYVTIDLQGYRLGSLNEPLRLQVV